MTNEMEFLDQDISNPAEASIENNPPQNPEVENTFVAPSWEDVKSGKVNYNDLPANMKAKIKQEAKEETPEDKKYLWDDYGFTPPQTYHGFDKSGRKVDGLDLDSFEELVKRGKIAKRTKIEQDVENLTHLVKEQNKTIISQQERDLDAKISGLKDQGLNSKEEFDTYEKLLSDKQDLKFQKLQLDKKIEPVEQPKPQADLSGQYSLEEQVAMEVFANNSENKTFIELMARNKEMEAEFDKTAYALKARNPNAPLDKIAAATKTIVENKFNLNKQQRPMTRNIIQSERKTNLDSQPTQRLTYGALSDRDKKWINSEARSGKPKYSGKSMDEITNMVYGHLLKK